MWSNESAIASVLQLATRIHVQALVELTTQFSSQFIELVRLGEEIKQVIFIPALKRININPTEADLAFIREKGFSFETIWPKPVQTPPISDADGTSSQADPVLPGPL